MHYSWLSFSNNKDNIYLLNIMLLLKPAGKLLNVTTNKFLSITFSVNCRQACQCCIHWTKIDGSLHVCRYFDAREPTLSTQYKRTADRSEGKDNLYDLQISENKAKVLFYLAKKTFQMKFNIKHTQLFGN